MPIVVDNDKDIEFVRNQILFLVGAFPNLHWDINISTGSWILTLVEIKTTKAELERACKKIVKNGFQDWEVNLSLVLDMIKIDRDNNKLRLETQNRFEQERKKELSLPSREERARIFKKIRGRK